MEYIAFKALVEHDHALFSPRGTPWMYDLQGRPTLVADSMDAPHGIYAATWDEAANYGDKIYMVVPFLFDGGVPVIALATHGWRSSEATVIAGPWPKNSKEGMRQAAEFILASYMQGYRQVEGILVWAAGVVASSDENALPIVLPVLERAMRDAAPDVREQAVHVAGRIGALAIHILERAIQDADPDVRRQAVYEAGQIGVPAISILEIAMRDAAPDVREQAVHETGRIGAPAIHILERAIQDADPDVRRQAVYVAGRIGAPALHILERAIQDADPDIRWQAVYVAGRIGAPALHILERAMEDSDQDVRAEAVKVSNRAPHPR